MVERLIPGQAPVLLELDPTNQRWHNTMGGQNYTQVVGKHTGWCNDGHFRDMCDCDETCMAPYSVREDPFDFYEDALGG
jgi:hypothetical protein